MTSQEPERADAAAIRAGAEATAGMAARLAAAEHEIGELKAAVAGLREAAHAHGPPQPLADGAHDAPQHLGGAGEEVGTGADSSGIAWAGDETVGAQPPDEPDAAGGTDVGSVHPAAKGETPPLTDSFGAGGADTDGARIVALNMALNGSSREAVDKFLSEHFAVKDQAALLDDVFAKVK